MAAPLVVVLAAALGAGPAAAAPDAPESSTGPAPVPAGAEGEWLTLVTGDRVNVEPAGDGRWTATVEPATRIGDEPSFETIEYGEGLYLIPSDASALLGDQLDRELFNVTKLVEYGYTEGVPVIVTGTAAEGARTAVAPASLPVTRHLPSVEGYAATVAADGAWWRSVAPAVTDGARFATADPLPAGQKVWLDDKATVTLDESVPMVGAPQAWADGYDGSGTTVAVLDSGIDTSHPDLADKVAQSQDFVAGEDPADHHGHGTHVAGTIAGIGAASGGGYQGVAPGATLLNGKICDRTGSCPNSAIIAGMEWAAPLADVVNMSIGSNSPSDGTDPVSQAVNALTAEHDTLFVIAAGNNGGAGAGSVGSPGAADAALTVGSVDKAGQLAATSGRGPRLGDFAIKPDITAPGVDIVAPRAAGTTIGTPVDDSYTSLSGTSMATPHVAGAVAIVRQQDPDLSAAEVKAALTTTAAPSGSLTVYRQGGGLLNIPQALATPVIATPSPLNLGYFPYTEDDSDPVDAQVTYANRSTSAVTLDLSLNVRDGGAVPPAAMLSVHPSTVVIEPGGTATATVTLDIDEGEVGAYGGYLRATGDGVAVHTPVGLHKEAPVHELTVTGIARDGQPAQGGSIDVIDAHDTRDFFTSGLEFLDGTVSVRVPSGNYQIAGVIESSFGHSWSQDRTMAAHQIEVTGDTEVVLDARKGRPVRIDTPAHPDAVPLHSLKFGYRFAAEQYGFSRHTVVAIPWKPMYVLESDPVTQGEFDFYTQTRLAEPPVTLAVTGPEARTLNPRLMYLSPAVAEFRSLRLVSVGSGEDADYAGVDAEGAVVLAKINPLGGGSYYETIARKHGAAALLIMNDNAENVSMSMSAASQIPGLTISGAEGEVLQGMLSQGPVTVQLGGNPASPYVYDVTFPESGALPALPSYAADPQHLATHVNSYHGAPGMPMGDVRSSWLPYETTSLAVSNSLPGPQVRTEYVTPGDVLYRQRIAALAPNRARLLGPITSYQAGEQRKESWFASPLRPGIIDTDGTHQAAVPSVRTADTLNLEMTEWSDTDASHTGGLNGDTDTSAFRLYQDGTLIAEALSARVPGLYEVSPDPATYQLELQVARRADWWPTSTATRTVWTLQSRRPADGVTEVLPLLQVEYDAHVDVTNTAPRSHRPTMDLTVRHQQGAEGGRIGRARVSVSYDGEQWRPAAVVPRGDGTFTVSLPPTTSLPTDATSASLRVTVADSHGNQLEQEITNAWRLPGG